MKTRSKVFLSMMCAVLLIAASVMGTMAYLQSTDEVKNTFTVGQVALTLDEAKVNDDGTVVAGADRVKENNYKLMPGHNYTKDPTIHVAEGSEDCYLFVKVENGIKDIEADKTILAQMAEKGWKEVEGYTGLYVYTETVENETKLKIAHANDNVVVFDDFTVKGDTTNEGLKTYGSAKITVTAYAVQKDGFENKTAADIWSATSAAFGA